MYYEIDFDGNVKTIIEIVDNKIKVIKAMNGYGEKILIKNIKINLSDGEPESEVGK